MTNSNAEIEDADCIFVIGSNTTENHPVLGTKMARAHRKGATLIVADPRRIPLCDEADLYLPVQPGTNIALIHAMCHVILKEGLEDRAFIEERTEGIEFLEELLVKYSPEYVEPICGVPAEDIRKAARLFASAGAAGIYYAMGITQHSRGTNGVMALSNLALLTGNIGKYGAGINPLRGQNNVQGACDMGCLPSDLPGYQKVIKPAVISQFEDAWHRPLSDKVGKTLSEMLNGCTDGSMRMLYVFGENPAVSDPDTNHVEHALESCEFLVVQDLFMTETAEFADVILPAASFAEKDGTFTNTERRVQRVRKVISPQNNARADWQIFMELLWRLGIETKYKHPQEIFAEIASVTPSYRGITYSRIDEEGIQWPCPDADHPGTPILHTQAIARGRGLFVDMEYEDPFEMADDEYPYILTTGRILYHYHTRTMTGRTQAMNEIAGEAYVEMHPILASRFELKDGEMVQICSRRGCIEVAVRITDRIEEEVLFIPFHFAKGANVLTNTALDPIAKIPELKVAAVSIHKIGEQDEERVRKYS